MATVLFITGAGGYIGTRLIFKLQATGIYEIRALLRRPVAYSKQTAGVDFVIGDVGNAEGYRASLRGADIVVHLAAVTGKAAPSVYEQANVEATKILLDACKEASVGRFLYVSTIAATYADQRHYNYAQSKNRAERLVRESGIPYAIVRPTVVLGRDSPIWQTFRHIAELPIIPLPNGGQARLQPICVDDLVAGIELALLEGRFEGDALDLGGPAPLSFAEFITLTRRALYGGEPRFIRFPLAPVRMILALAEPLLRPILPVTAGQLTMFANDGIVSSNWLHDKLKPLMRNTADTVAALVETSSGLPHGATKSKPVAVQRATLARECRVFSRYLASQEPTAYIREQYQAAAVARELANPEEFSSFDRKTLWLARQSIVLTHLADTYCVVFHRNGALRRKLILLLAILEHTAPTANRFDRSTNRGSISVTAHLLRAGLVFGLSLIVATILFLPLQIASQKDVDRKPEKHVT
jgi:NADH dehydrogenase